MISNEEIIPYLRKLALYDYISTLISRTINNFETQRLNFLSVFVCSDKLMEKYCCFYILIHVESTL